jgi:hypothetical protein
VINPTKPKRIQVLTSSEDEWTHVTSYIEELYLSESQCFEIELNRQDLDRVEDFFDGLIQRHGIRAAEFLYVFKD